MASPPKPCSPTPARWNRGARDREVYGAEVSKQTITAITDRVIEGTAEWQSRPLDRVYAVVFVDAIDVKIRDGQVANRPV